MTDIWTPDTSDQAYAREGYRAYIKGVALLNCPDIGFPLEVRDRELNEANIPEIVMDAKTLIWDGLRAVIQFSNPSQLRSPIERAEVNFDTAYDHMFNVKETAYGLFDPSINYNHAWYLHSQFRPCPVLDRVIYHAICHGRKTMSARRLMDSVLPSILVRNKVDLPMGYDLEGIRRAG